MRPALIEEAKHRAFSSSRFVQINCFASLVLIVCRLFSLSAFDVGIVRRIQQRPSNDDTTLTINPRIFVATVSISSRGSTPEGTIFLSVNLLGVAMWLFHGSDRLYWRSVVFPAAGSLFPRPQHACSTFGWLIVSVYPSACRFVHPKEPVVCARFQAVRCFVYLLFRSFFNIKKIHF